MNCPNRDCAKVGDIIEITSEGRWLCGKKLVVIPTPEPEKTKVSQLAGDAWTLDSDESGSLKCFRFGEYKIIKK